MYQVGNVIPILHIKKLRHSLTQSHTAAKWQSWGSNPGKVASEPSSLQLCYAAHLLMNPVLEL